MIRDLIDAAEALAGPSNTPRELQDGEFELVAGPELLAWRQVHPKHVQDQVVGGDAFSSDVEARFLVTDEAFRGGGSGDDVFMVSMSRGDRATAREAYEARAAHASTVGSFGVSMAEVRMAHARLVDDSEIVTHAAAVHHVFLDLTGFRSNSKAQRKAVREFFAYCATERGRMFPKGKQ